MRKFILLLLVAPIFCNAQKASDKAAIDNLLSDWHKAAAAANFDEYFGMMSKDAIFIGTDATENWNLEAFKAFAKPYFDKGKAWDFVAVERNIFVNGNIAWFDELLDTKTNMKLCRGSGVLRKENGKWKIAHYVLSMTIPNDKVRHVVQDKSAIDDAILEKIKKK